MEKGVGLQTVTDMDEHGEMKQEVYNLAAFAIEQFVTEVEISKHIKVRCVVCVGVTAAQAHFDQKYGPTWHCVVGSDFKAFVTHESKHFIFFYQVLRLTSPSLTLLLAGQDGNMFVQVRLRAYNGTQQRDPRCHVGLGAWRLDVDTTHVWRDERRCGFGVAGL